MTPIQYRAALASLGLSVRRTAKLMGVTERQARRWAAGDAKVPGSVVACLRLLLDIKKHDEPSYFQQALEIIAG